MRKYIGFLIVVFSFSACENFLDVKPEGEFLGDILFETSEGCEDALYGVYANLGSTSLYGKTLSYYLPDILASYYIAEGTSNTSYMYQWSHYNYTGEDSDRSVFDEVWTRMYENISYVNSVLFNLEGKENSFRYYNFYKGEALALRAFMHFELCCYFAPAYREETLDQPAIPYCETYEPLVYPFRTVKDVYQKVITDLHKAEELLKDENKFLNPLSGHAVRENTPGVDAFMSERQFHLNLYAVQGLLARVYWMKNDLDSAMIYADKVISSQKFALTERVYLYNDYASRISVNEALWGVCGQSGWEDQLDEKFNNPSDNLLDGGLLPLNGFILMSSRPEGLMPASWGYAQIYEVPDYNGQQDYRLNWFQYYDANGKYRHFYKVCDRTDTYRGQKGVNMIRLPEMYLIMAEGLLKKEQLTEAREYFDKYTETRGFVYREEDAEFNMDLINKEYRKEFMGEGRMWLNMKRQNLTLNSCFQYNLTIPGSDEVYVWPIPEDEFEYREGGKEGVYHPENIEDAQTN